MSQNTFYFSLKKLKQFVFFITIILFYLLTACKKDKSPILSQSTFPVWNFSQAQTYVNKGKNLLQETSFHNFFHLINQYENKYPQETKDLLYDYAKELNKLIRHHSAKKDYHRLAHFFKSVKSLNTVPPNIQADFAYKLILALEQTGHLGSAAILRQDYLNLQKEIEHNKTTEEEPQGKEENIKKVESVTDKWNARAATEEVIYDQLVQIHLSNPHNEKITGAWLNQNHCFSSIKHPALEKITNYLNISAYAILPNGKQIPLKYQGIDSYTETIFFSAEQTNHFAEPLIHLIPSEITTQKDEIYRVYYRNEADKALSHKSKVHQIHVNEMDLEDWIILESSQTLTPGALVINQEDRVIGMIIAQAQANQYFCLPLNLLFPIYDQVLYERPIQRPWLGIKTFKKKEKEGLFIRYTYATSPLSAYGISQDHQLLAINEKKINDLRDAKNIIMGFDPGNPVSLLIQSPQKQLEKKWLFFKRRPDWPSLPITLTEPWSHGVWLNYGLLLDEKAKIWVKIKIDGQKKKWPAYPLLRTNGQPLKSSIQVETGSFLLLVDDQQSTEARKITFLHLPEETSIREIEKQITKYRIVLECDKYDSAIL